MTLKRKSGEKRPGNGTGGANRVDGGGTFGEGWLCSRKDDNGFKRKLLGQVL